MSTEMIVIVVALVVAAILFFVQHKRTSANTAVTKELGSAIKAVPSLVASHVERASGAIKAKVDAATTVLRTDIAKVLDHAPATPLPVVGTANEPATVASVATPPAAPAA